MLRQQARIIGDRAQGPSSPQSGDLHEETGHHRYYGSSALNGGERIVESRSGSHPRSRKVCGF